MTIRVLLALMLVGQYAAAMGRRPAKEDGAPVGTKNMSIQEWKGSRGGPKTRGHQIVGNAADWRLAWRELGEDTPEAPDFTKYVALFVYIGERPTGGWTAVFDEPVAQGDDLLVRYRIPEPTGFTTQAFTQPWRVRAFPKPKGRLIVESVK